MLNNLVWYDKNKWSYFEILLSFIKLVMGDLLGVFESLRDGMELI